MQGLREAFGRISFVGDREQITSRVQEILEIRVRRRGVEIAGLDRGRGRTAVTSKGIRFPRDVIGRKAHRVDEHRGSLVISGARERRR